MASPLSYSELNDGQRSHLQRGGRLVLRESFPGAVWPKLVLYRMISLTPEEYFSLYLDFSIKTNYVQNLNAVEVTPKWIAPKFSAVYSVTYPLPFPLSDTDADNSYDEEVYEADFSAQRFRIGWQGREVRYAKNIWGSFSVERVGNQTLLIEVSAMVPSFSRLLAAFVGEDRLVKAAIEATDRRIHYFEKLKGEGVYDLPCQIRRVRKAMYR